MGDILQNMLVGIVAVLVLIYLFWSLIRPEQF